MSEELKVYKGKATNVQMESIHGTVADIYEKAIDGINLRFEQQKELARAKAEDEGVPYVEPDMYLTKEDLALLSEAQKFLKSNNVEMSVVKKSGSKAFSSKINQFNKEKKEVLIS